MATSSVLGKPPRKTPMIPIYNPVGGSPANADFRFKGLSNQNRLAVSNTRFKHSKATSANMVTHCAPNRQYYSAISLEIDDCR